MDGRYGPPAAVPPKLEPGALIAGRDAGAPKAGGRTEVHAPLNGAVSVGFILAVMLTARSPATAAPPETTKGGAGGREIVVTRLDDDPKHPAKGSLRWALKQKGPRVVKFAVAGDILLRDELTVREPFLTIDGSNAPVPGISIRGGSLMFKNTHDLLVRQVRIRLGEEPARRQRREQGMNRPKHSAGLDCVSLDGCERIVFDHCSLSWSCDEIFGIVRCREVVIRWCILSEPLGDPHLHPYGDNHAYVLNASASTLSVHHCLFAHFVMRGPQFESNDMRRQDDYPVEMEAVNNVIFDYQRSGSRYGCGVEKDNGTAKDKAFRFQFLGNLYLSGSAAKLPIEGITRHGVIPNVRVHASGNVLLAPGTTRQILPGTPRLFAPGKGPVLPQPGVLAYREVAVEKHSDVRRPFWKREEGSGALGRQLSGRPLFSTAASAEPEPAQVAAARVLDEAGCNRRRDAVDRRIIKDVIQRRYGLVRRAVPRN